MTLLKYVFTRRSWGFTLWSSYLLFGVSSMCWGLADGDLASFWWLIPVGVVAWGCGPHWHADWRNWLKENE